MNQRSDPNSRCALVASATTRVLTLALALAVLPAPAPGQNRVVLHGTVLDSDTREPLRGAQIFAPLSERSAVTDSVGSFEISFIKDTHYELVAAAMGYAPTRVTLPPEAEQSSTSIELVPDPQAMVSLAVLHEGLEERRRQRRTPRLRVIDHVELGASDAPSAYTFVRRVTGAQACQSLQELCRLGRRVRLCIDDASPIRGARELEAYTPSDLWLMEIYREGREVRVYTRWFIERVIRTRRGELRRIPIC